MKFYKVKGEIFAYEGDGSQDHLIPQSAVALTEDEVTQHLTPIITLEQQKLARAAAFRMEADPLFFKWSAGEGTEVEWQQKREEIRTRYPYPEE
jgi:hypothetical protein